MKKYVMTAMLAFVATSAMANVPEDQTTSVTSPRTGIEYTLLNPNKTPIVLQIEKIAPATSANVDRIVAKNPALSAESQAMAVNSLLQSVSAQNQTTAEHSLAQATR